MIIFYYSYKLLKRGIYDRYDFDKCLEKSRKYKFYLDLVNNKDRNISLIEWYELENV